MIGDGKPGDMPFGEFTPEEQEQIQPDYHQLEAAEREWYQLVEKARQCTDAVLMTAEEFNREVQAKAEGCWVSVATRAESFLGKLAEKALTYSVVKLSEAYSDAMRLGLRIPTIEEILQGYGDPVGPGDIEPCKAGACNVQGLELDCLLQPGGCHYAVPKALIDDKGNITYPFLVRECDTGQQVPTPPDCLDKLYPQRKPAVDITGMIITSPTSPYPQDQYTWPTFPPNMWMQVGTGMVPIGTITSPGYPIIPNQITGQPGYPPTGSLGSSGGGGGGIVGPGGIITTGGGSCPAPCPPILDPAQLSSDLKKGPPLPVKIEQDEPPTTPEVPPDPNVDVPPSAQVTVDSGKHTALCERYDYLYKSFAAAGKVIHEGIEYGFSQVVQVFTHFSMLPTQTMTEWMSMAAKQYKNAYAGRVTGPYIEALQNSFNCDIQQFIYVLTFRNFLQYVSGISVDRRNIWHAETTSELPIKIQKVAEFIFGHNLHQSAIRDMGTSAKWEPYVMPLLDMIDKVLIWACPREIPKIPEAIEAYLKDQIDDKQLACLIEANGGIYEEYEWVVQARREQLNSDEIIQLWRRQEIDDAALEQRLRAVGFLKLTEMDDKKKLSQEIPPVTDLIRFMTRNIYNKDVLSRFDLDAEADKSGLEPGGQLDKWLKANGLTKDAVTAYWRAHWQVPSPGTMGELVQRNRPGRVPKDIEVTVEDFDRVLRENDWLEFWRKRMLNLAYHVINRVDARRLFQSGAIDRVKFKDIVQDQGYKTDDAELMTKWMESEIRKKVRDHKYVKAYEAYGMARAKVVAKLQAEGFSADTINSALMSADEDNQIANQAKCVAEVAKRYERGELDAFTVRSQLLSMGLEPQQVQRAFEQWDCFVKSQDKRETASTLCDWYVNGIIKPDEFASRLTMLGYSSQDVTHILSRCVIKLEDKQRKEMEKEQREAEKRKKKAERELKDRQAKHDDITKLAEQLAKINGSNAFDEIKNIELIVNNLESSQGVGWDDIYHVLMDAKTKLPTKGPIDFYYVVMDAWQTYEQAGDIPPHLEAGPS